MTTKPYLDFYQKNDVSPVLNECDHEFLKRREALYFQLGIVPELLRGKSIIEFGPGNGINSLFTYSNQPNRYVLVDGNSKALKNCESNFKKLYNNLPGLELKESCIEEYSTDEEFDLVICEGVLPHQKDPAKFIRHITPLVKKGGILLFTTHDYISTFSEVLRAFFSYLVTDQNLPFNDQVTFVTDFLKNHFRSLKSMNRSQEDWVIDNVLYTDYWKSSPWFSIGEAIDELATDFTFYNSSPDFRNDWRWYKDLTSSDPSLFNNHAKEKYLQNMHNFLDYRHVFTARSEESNLVLYEKIKTIRGLISLYVDSKQNFEILGNLIRQLEEVEGLVREFSPETADSIQCYNLNLSNFKENGAIPLFSKFNTWWGRGMQFVTFLKTN